MVDLSFILARFLCADDAHQIFVTPHVDDPINLRIDPAQRDSLNLAAILPVVDALQHLVLEDGGTSISEWLPKRLAELSNTPNRRRLVRHPVLPCGQSLWCPFRVLFR